ncbi:MAG TPA: DedA family protein [Nakamurella sp.]
MNPLDASSIITATGLIGVFVVLVAETGLLVGFFLPGDSLLFTAGLLAASQGPARLPLGPLLAVAAAGALIGAQLGYVIGKRLGTRLLARTARPALHRGVARSKEAIDRYGPAKAVVLARFIPIVRTVMNPMAGVLGVPPRTFTVSQVLGGVVWTTGIILAGYWLGNRIPGIDAYLLPIIAVIIAVSLIPVLLEVRRVHRTGRSQVSAAAPVEAAAPGRVGER